MGCPTCGADVVASSRFCSECGTRLAVDGPDFDRRIVTALFCDLVGSTSLGEQLDPEDLARILIEYQSLARSHIESHGGTVEKFIGDAVVGVFGVPMAHEDDAERAMAASLGITDTVAKSNLGIEVRIGVATGEAFTRRNFDRSSGEGLAMGDCMNTAARLQAIAPPMSVFVSERTYSAAAGAFRFEQLGPVVLKGRAGPLPVWRLIGEAPASAEAPDVGPFVGRSHEQRSLLRAFARLAQGQGGALLIEGEAGIGKSRLVRETRRQVHEPLWLRGRSVETRDAAGYRPIGEMLRVWSTAPTWEALSASASELGLSSADAPFLAAVAGIDLPSREATRLGDLTPEAIRPSLYRAVRAWAAALAARSPVVLEFEDWHWADGASVQLVGHIMPLASQLPLLILLLRRSTSPKATGAAEPSLLGGSTETIRLGPLDDSAAASLFAALAASAGEDLRRAAQSRSEGNPYFIQELSRYMAEGEAGGSALPDSVRSVVTARVDRLPPDLRTLLRAASVAGRTFSRSIVAELAPGADTAQQLERLVSTGLIYPVDGDTYRFAHALTREAVYEGIANADRRERHAVLASSLERRGRDEHLPAIAYHLARAEDWEAAADALIEAGQQAAKLASDDEALAMFEEALHAHERLPEGHWGSVERAAIERQIADSLQRLGRPDEARRRLVAALATLGIRMPVQKRAVKRGVVRQLLKRWLGPPDVPSPGPPPRPADKEISRELELLGWIDYFQDGGRYALASLMLANHAARGRDTDGMGIGTMRSTHVFDALGRREMAERYALRAQEATEHMEDPLTTARVLTSLATHDFATKSFEEAQASAKRCLQHGYSAEYLRDWGGVQAILGLSTVMHGAPRKALVIADHMRDAGIKGGELQVQAWAIGLEGLARLHLKEFEAAVETLPRALELSLQVSDHVSATLVAGGLAMATLRVGAVERARAEILRAKKEARSRGILGFVPTLLIEAEVELSMIELATTIDRRRTKAAARAVKRSHRHAKLCAFHAVHAQVMDGCLQWLVGRRELAEQMWTRARTLAEELGYLGVFREAIEWTGHCSEAAGLEAPRHVADRPEGA